MTIIALLILSGFIVLFVWSVINAFTGRKKDIEEILHDCETFRDHAAALGATSFFVDDSLYEVKPEKWKKYIQVSSNTKEAYSCKTASRLGIKTSMKGDQNPTYIHVLPHKCFMLLHERPILIFRLYKLIKEKYPEDKVKLLPFSRTIQICVNNELIEKQRQAIAQKQNSADACFSNPAFCAELAERIIEYTNPMIAYLKKTYPDYPENFFDFYPLTYLFYVLDEFSLEFDLMYAFNVAKELSSRADYVTCVKPGDTLDFCPIVKQIWDGLMDIYRQNEVDYGIDKAAGMLFVILIGNSIGKRSEKIDPTLLQLSGVGMRGLLNDTEKLQKKYA